VDVSITTSVTFKYWGLLKIFEDYSEESWGIGASITTRMALILFRANYGNWR
jgi:hypothetical protein